MPAIPLRLHKYQALGNDYLVLHEGEASALEPATTQKICHRHFGVGSDGILVPSMPTGGADFGLRILNPDGSEAEKSGNGLRIYARYLWDQRRVAGGAFTVSTLGGLVRSQVRNGGQHIFVEMGRASFDSAKIPVRGKGREVVDEAILISALTCKRSGADPPFLAARPTRNPAAPLTDADLIFVD